MIVLQIPPYAVNDVALLPAIILQRHSSEGVFRDFFEEGRREFIESFGEPPVLISELLQSQGAGGHSKIGKGFVLARGRARQGGKNLAGNGAEALFGRGTGTREMIVHRQVCRGWEVGERDDVLHGKQELAKVQVVESDEAEGQGTFARDWTHGISLCFVVFNGRIDSCGVGCGQSEVRRVAGALANEGAGQEVGCSCSLEGGKEVGCLL